MSPKLPTRECIDNITAEREDFYRRFTPEGDPYHSWFIRWIYPMTIQAKRILQRQCRYLHRQIGQAIRDSGGSPKGVVTVGHMIEEPHH